MAKIDILRRFALWDIDGTMSKEITHFKLVEYLVETGLFTQEMADVTKGYLKNYQLAKKDLLEYEYTYEQFINDLLTSFARGLAGQKASVVQQFVSNFFEANEGEMFYPFVQPTIDHLADRGIKSVLVTGNTQFTAKAVKSLFDLQNDASISSTIEINKSGIVTGNLTTALAESSQKIAAIKRYLGQHAIIVAAFGDSSADEGMLKLAWRGYGISKDGEVPKGLEAVEGLVVPPLEQLEAKESLFPSGQLLANFAVGRT